MTTKTQMIIDELTDIATAEQLSEYARTNGTVDYLEQHKSLVQTRLGGDYSAEAWDEAREILRTERQDDAVTETTTGVCLRCGLESEREMVVGETEHASKRATDACSRCGSHDARWA